MPRGTSVGYSWGISRSLRATVLPEPLVESGCDAVVLPRNEKVVDVLMQHTTPSAQNDTGRPISEVRKAHQGRVLRARLSRHARYAPKEWIVTMPLC